MISLLSRSRSASPIEVEMVRMKVKDVKGEVGDLHFVELIYALASSLSNGRVYLPYILFNLICMVAAIYEDFLYAYASDELQGVLD